MQGLPSLLLCHTEYHPPGVSSDYLGGGRRSQEKHFHLALIPDHMIFFLLHVLPGRSRAKSLGV